MRVDTRFALAFLAVATIGAFAHADEKQTCIDAHSQSQKLRRAGKLLDAQRALLVCSRDVCPPAVVQDCSTWRNEIDGEIPSFVVAARDEAGRDLVAVRVRIDGQIVATKLDGQPIVVDPGTHVFRYESEDGRFVETTVVVHTSEKARPLRVDFGAPIAPVVTHEAPVVVQRVDAVPVSQRRAVPLGTWVIGGLGLVALGVFTGLAVDGYSRESHLRDTCGQTHGCSPVDVGNIETEYHFADVSLGVSVVAIGIAATIAIVRSLSKSQATRAAPPMRSGVQGIIGGVF